MTQWRGSHVIFPQAIKFQSALQLEVLPENLIIQILLICSYAEAFVRVWQCVPKFSWAVPRPTPFIIHLSVTRCNCCTVFRFSYKRPRSIMHCWFYFIWRSLQCQLHWPQRSRLVRASQRIYWSCLPRIWVKALTSYGTGLPSRINYLSMASPAVSYCRTTGQIASLIPHI